MTTTTSGVLGLVAGLGIATAAHAAEGMPQLRFESPLTLSQVVWGALIFFGLYFLLKNSALPQVSEVLENRAARIASDLDTARGAKADADAAVAESASADRKARADAQAQVASALAQAKAEAAAQAHVAEERLNAQLAASEARIGEARRTAMGALRQIASETTSAVVARLTGRAPDQAAVDAAVGTVLAARPSSSSAAAATAASGAA